MPGTAARLVKRYLPRRSGAPAAEGALARSACSSCGETSCAARTYSQASRAASASIHTSSAVSAWRPASAAASSKPGWVSASTGAGGGNGSCAGMRLASGQPIRAASTAASTACTSRRQRPRTTNVTPFHSAAAPAPTRSGGNIARKLAAASGWRELTPMGMSAAASSSHQSKGEERRTRGPRSGRSSTRKPSCQSSSAAPRASRSQLVAPRISRGGRSSRNVCAG